MSHDRRAGGRGLVLLGVMMIGFAIVMDLLSAMGHGGSFSIVTALQAVHAEAPSIEIDGAGLRCPITICLCLIVLGGVRLCHVEVTKGWRLTVAIMVVVLGGFLVSTIYGRTMITQYMAAQGYGRCPSRDHVAGSGKGRIWFYDYVRNRADCPPGADPRITIRT
jgi:hypothetical protein